VAIADRAGGDWPQRARAAAAALSQRRASDDATLGIRLLGDIRTVLDGSDKVASEDLLRRLHDLPEAPWGDYYGRPISARKVAQLLRAYDVRSATLRIADRTPRGYHVAALGDAFDRYLPPQSATSATTVTGQGFLADSQVQQTPDVAHSETAENPYAARVVADVALATEIPGSEGDEAATEDPEADLDELTAAAYAGDAEAADRFDELLAAEEAAAIRHAAEVEARAADKAQRRAAAGRRDLDRAAANIRHAFPLAEDVTPPTRRDDG